MEEVTAFILAGGKSSRMGRDKAFLELGGKALLAHMLQLAAAVASSVHIVGPAAKFAGWGAVVEDVIPGEGPLSGIHAALSTTSSRLNVILAVDLPFVQPHFLAYLIRRAADTEAIVTVPRTAARLHALCAVYRRAFRERAEEALRAGRNQIAPLLQLADTLILDEAELAALSFPSTMFDNLNTPQEYTRARAAWGKPNA
jgi:molybdopterin-guanine dinucleotide biosynthesis protein A